MSDLDPEGSLAAVDDGPREPGVRLAEPDRVNPALTPRLIDDDHLRSPIT
jgi:hypothetical protein